MFTKFSLSVLLLAASSALAEPYHQLLPRDPGLTLFQRQSCPSNSKSCGDYCTYASYKCCPSGGGGCPQDSNCEVGSNGITGCCPIGRICSGPGGIQTGLGGIYTSTPILSYFSTAVPSATYSSIMPYMSTPFGGPRPTFTDSAGTALPSPSLSLFGTTSSSGMAVATKAPAVRAKEVLAMGAVAALGFAL